MRISAFTSPLQPWPWPVIRPCLTCAARPHDERHIARVEAEGDVMQQQPVGPAALARLHHHQNRGGAGGRVSDMTSLVHNEPRRG